jgi:hypothetical protein
MNNANAMLAGYHVRLDWTAPSKILFNVKLAHTFPTTTDAIEERLMALLHKHDIVAVHWFNRPSHVVLCRLDHVYGVTFAKNTWQPYDGHQVMYIGLRDELMPDDDNNADWWQEIEHFCVGEHVFLLD